MEILECELVPVLKLSIIVALLLNGVICEVDVYVVEVIGVVLFARCANVPIIVVVPFLHTINGGPQAVCTDVKLPPLD